MRLGQFRGPSWLTDAPSNCPNWIDRTNELSAAYQSLAQSEARYKSLYEDANDIIFTADLTGRFTTANSRAVELFVPPGMRPGEMSFGNVLTPESLERTTALMRQAFSGDSHPADEQPWEFEGRDKDGNAVYLEVKARIVREDGVIKGIHGIARNITQRRKAQEDRAKLWSAVERAGEGIFMLSPDRRYTYANDAFCNTYRITRGKLIGESSAVLRSDRYPESFHDALYSDLEAGKTWSARLTRTRRDGTPVQVAVTIAPVRNASGAIIHYVGIERDITEHLQMEEQLRQTQKMESLGTLAGGIAHDFNNVLAIIMGNAELALDDIEEETARDNMQQILKASKRAKDLTKQILAFSRRTKRERNPLKLAPLLTETYRLLRGTTPTTITMELSIRTEADTVLADPSEMQQVLINLAANASYAMEKAGGTLTIGMESITVKRPNEIPDAELRPGRYVKLTVQDTGCGMTDKVRERIFEPFFTTKGKEQGTGMGLAVVYGIVKSHDGHVTVESRVGEGSIFNVFLPFLETEAAGKEEEQGGDIRGGKEKVLLVDDDPGVLQAESHILERLGYQVWTAEGGSEACRVFRKDPGSFDLVVTDQVMPRLTGIGLAKRILKTRKDLPVILLTGYSDTVSAGQARAAGISEFVMKPLDRLEAAKIIRRVLDRKELNQE